MRQGDDHELLPRCLETRGFGVERTVETGRGSPFELLVC